MQSLSCQTNLKLRSLLKGCLSPGQCFCLAGYFCPGSNSTNAQPCPEGTFNNIQNGVSQASACRSCPKGSFCNTTATVVPRSCPQGTTCPAGSKHPLPCPSGSYCNGPSTSPVACPPRHFCKPNATFPAPCPPGTFSAAFNATACQLCPANTYSPFLSGNAECLNWTTCAAGQYVATNGSATENVQCKPCAAGTYWPEHNVSIQQCLLCPTGWVSTQGATTCSKAQGTPSPSPAPSSSRVPVASPGSTTRISDQAESMPAWALALIMAGSVFVVLIASSAVYFYRASRVSRPKFRFQQRARIDQQAEVKVWQDNPRNQQIILMRQPQSSRDIGEIEVQKLGPATRRPI